MKSSRVKERASGNFRLDAEKGAFKTIRAVTI